MSSTSDYEIIVIVIVIGGGQAGLAIGHHLLARQERRFTILGAAGVMP